MKKVKVLHVAHAVGGVDIYIRQITEHLNTDLFEMVIVHGIDDTKQLYIDKGQNKIKEYKISIDRNIHPIKDIAAIFKLIAIIRKEKPNLIHAHSSKGGVLARTSSLFTNVKVLYTPNAFSFLSTPNKFKRRVFILIEKLLSPFSVLLAASYSEADRGAHNIRISEKKIEVFENSIPPISSEQYNREISISLPEQFICSVGRPSYQKNIEEMVKVFRKINLEKPELYFVLMGVGFYSPNLEGVKKLLKEFGLEDKFIMIPWIAREDIFPIIRKSLVYISTARYEGLPYSIIEGLAIGKAFVVSDCDGNKDLVTNDSNGYVIKEAELSEKMPAAVLRLVENTELREAFERESRRRFDEKHDINKNIFKLETLYLKYAIN